VWQQHSNAFANTLTKTSREKIVKRLLLATITTAVLAASAGSAVDSSPDKLQQPQRSADYEVA
jgi:hypothetical protein